MQDSTSAPSASLEEEGFHQFFRVGNQEITLLDTENFFTLELSQHSGGGFAGYPSQFSQFPMGKVQINSRAMIGLDPAILA